MSVLSFIPELWSALLNGYLKKNLVYGSAINTKWQGEIKGQGSRVRIPDIGDVDVNDYVRNSTTLTYQELSDASQFLDITESKSFSFKIDDVDTAQGTRDLIGPATEKASYTVRDVMDQFVAGILVAGASITTGLGTSTTPLEIDSVNAWDTLLHIARLLDDAKVPRGGRFVIVPPWMIQKLGLGDVTASTNNVETLREGLVERRAGFDILMSHNVPHTSSTKYKIVAGTTLAATFASQLEKIEALRLEGSFSDAVRGLYLYGSKVTHPEALALATVNEASEVE
jgi:coat protein Gp5